mmetsp:Transcript_43286/g.125125  ORF Transcript_43286/g.125125 Transcript_43286/m.125125 type:complete len:767 (-) Transcript_43286:168-2468(-)
MAAVLMNGTAQWPTSAAADNEFAGLLAVLRQLHEGVCAERNALFLKVAELTGEGLDRPSQGPGRADATSLPMFEEICEGPKPVPVMQVTPWRGAVATKPARARGEAAPQDAAAPGATPEQDQNHLPPVMGTESPRLEDMMISDATLDPQYGLGDSIPLQGHPAAASDGAAAAGKLLPVWTQAPNPCGSRVSRERTGDNLQSHSNLTAGNVVRMGDKVSNDGCMSMLVISPSSKWRLGWDLLTFLAMGYDMVFLPLQAFQPPRSGMLEWATTVFWCIDMILSFFSGFQEGGLVEMRWSRVAMKYLRSWFMFDFLLVSLDWVLLLQTDQEGADMFGLARLGKYGKVIRLMRILRMVRLIRLVKVLSILAEFSDFLHSEVTQSVFSLVKLLAAIAALSHCVACAWYFVGASEVDTWSWVDELKVTAQVDRDFNLFYTTALHWSLTQFTPASMEVVPQNAVERGFTVGVIILALLCASSFLSSITASMTQLRRINEAQSRQYELARKYITDHKVQLELGNRVLGFVRRLLNQSKRHVHESDVPAFANMPESLKIELHAEVYLPTLLPHPLFFHHSQAGDQKELAMICHVAMSEITVMPNHELYSIGQQCKSMVFVTMGRATYVGEGRMEETVRTGGKLFEAALWLHCRHCGNLRATNRLELFQLEAEGLGKCIIGARVEVCYRRYARLYAEHFPAQDGALDPFAAVWSPFDVLQEMAQHAFEEVYVDCKSGRPGLSRKSADSWMSWRTTSRLFRTRAVSFMTKSWSTWTR